MELKSNNQVLAIFKEAGIAGFATTDPAKAMAKNREWDKPSITCPYNGEPRQVHPDVCTWHLEEKDPHCAGCPRAPTPVVELKPEQQQHLFSAIRR